MTALLTTGRDRPCRIEGDPLLACFRPMTEHLQLPVDETDPTEVDVALRRILEGTASATGEAFFPALVQNLAEALGTFGAWVTEYIPPAIACMRSRSGSAAPGCPARRWR